MPNDVNRVVIERPWDQCQVDEIKDIQRRLYEYSQPLILNSLIEERAQAVMPALIKHLGLDAGFEEPITLTLPEFQSNVTLQDQIEMTFVVGSDQKPFDFNINLNNLPPGLQFNNETGVIFGKCSKVGTYTFFISARDSKGRICRNKYTITVQPNEEKKSSKPMK
jgi:hypothetical protein